MIEIKQEIAYCLWRWRPRPDFHAIDFVTFYLQRGPINEPRFDINV